MAAVSASFSFQAPLFEQQRKIQGAGRRRCVRFASSASLVSTRIIFPRLTSYSRRFHVSCAAKAETVDKVCEIVRKQLALPPDSQLTPDTKFSALGADSLDTVEIVMGLEEEFGISVEEESSENITTVQEAADLIEKLVQKKTEA